MCNSNRAENSRNNEERCGGCGGQITEEGDSYSHCVACGLPLIQLGYDTGYTHPSEVQIRRRNNTLSRLGSQITRDGSSLSRRLYFLQNRMSQEKLSYVEKIVIEAENAGVRGRTLSVLEEVLNVSNTNNKLSTNRDTLKGCKILTTRIQKSEYKIRVFAVASLILLNRKLYPNPVLQIQEKWNIHRDDVSKEIKFISRQLISNDYNIPVNSSYLDEHSHIELRRNELLFHLNTFRDHLASYIDYTKVREIINKAITILSRCQRFDLHRVERQRLIEEMWTVKSIRQSERPRYLEIEFDWGGQQREGRPLGTAITSLRLAVTIWGEEEGGIEIAAWWQVRWWAKFMQGRVNRLPRALAKQWLRDASERGIHTIPESHEAGLGESE